MVHNYLFQVFPSNREQLNEFLKELVGNKDTQLEIDFEKANVEAEQDEILNKMTKKELIERCKYLQKVNIEINEERKDIATKGKQSKIEADKKANKLIAERNDLLIKLYKANSYIEYLKGIIENLKINSLNIYI